MIEVREGEKALGDGRTQTAARLFVYLHSRSRRRDGDSMSLGGSLQMILRFALRLNMFATAVVDVAPDDAC